jgi:hypothetical protein
MPSSHISQPTPEAPRVGRLPVVLDEADVVLERGRCRACLDARDGEVLELLRRGLHDDLVLEVAAEAVGVLAVAAVRRAFGRAGRRRRSTARARGSAGRCRAPWCRRRPRSRRPPRAGSPALPRSRSRVANICWIVMRPSSSIGYDRRVMRKGRVRADPPHCWRQGHVLCAELWRQSAAQARGLFGCYSGGACAGYGRVRCRWT